MIVDIGDFSAVQFHVKPGPLPPSPDQNPVTADPSSHSRAKMGLLPALPITVVHHGGRATEAGPEPAHAACSTWNGEFIAGDGVSKGAHKCGPIWSRGNAKQPVPVRLLGSHLSRSTLEQRSGAASTRDTIPTWQRTDGGIMAHMTRSWFHVERPLGARGRSTVATPSVDHRDL